MGADAVDPRRRLLTIWACSRGDRDRDFRVTGARAWGPPGGTIEGEVAVCKLADAFAFSLYSLCFLHMLRVT
ncbi:hypothetical protein NDU88_003827 [Pleurodeles waltl]|uniref:Uncharacterized protein n=1 Tax=Pleurodeles waltl TaxID=8319 RepID=A0AAV7TPS8_PLEWA|nr:hypothetical protein NDU88_003827 [Pleurodeles waltl]